jgi:hypothetical protein
MGIEFGASPSDNRFLNKRTEMWWDMAEWVKRRESCLPQDQELMNQLLGPSIEYKVKNKRACLCLETKEEMRKKGLPSPDRADSLCLTFAAPVAPHPTSELDEYMPKQKRINSKLANSRAIVDYDPLDRKGR